MPVRTAQDALTLRPTRFLRSSWPWRSALYLAAGAVLGCTGPLAALHLLAGELTLPQFAIGVAAYAPVVACAVPVARLERRRLRLVDGYPVGDPHEPLERPGWRHRLRVRLREQATWREFGHAIVSGGVLCWMDGLVVVFAVWYPVTFVFYPIFDPDEPLRYLVALCGVVLVLAAPYPVTAWAGARAALARALLAPRETDLGERLVEVTRSRARLVDAFEIERRRIERDLHDGAQQRLVALNMHLGLARLEAPANSPLSEQLATAHELAKQALTELRELIRGVHPQVLADRGLVAAVEDVAGRSPVPVDVDIRLPGRLPRPVEVTAYFVVVEALANVAKHSGATRALVTASIVEGRVRLRVEDDGTGGADPDAGTGLAGMVDRVAAVDGTVALSSPPGGPTVLQVEFAGIPDAWRE
ncbi:sensor histidine kinase [Phytohabitans aurantiacus]|jgi:signal transduction histidine kinase|uniref:histidine kinase n=1 Tax=Phytohabitans aurantiacus TaxID=3016789 RepID=A0ABQ5R924_9ACTN|nr:sensor histidine kinase [Phytohabitans aurantiacus]GLI02890.1 histidine kinase [Phytohabitans aurantiacus]